MSYSIKDTLLYLQTLLQGLASLSTVQIGEPMAPPVDKTASIFMMDNVQSSTTLSGTIEDYGIQIRVYYNALHEPTQDIEFDTQQAASDIVVALAANFTLGGEVRAVDFAGENGGKVTVRWGHLDVSGTMYRVVDIAVPLIVDDSAMFAA